MRILLTRLSALGDIVHTWPLAEALRSAPDPARLTWVVEESMRPLVDGHPAVDEVVTVATRRWRRAPHATRTRRELAELRARLREVRADLSIDPQGVLKSAFITRLSAARRRVGLARPWRRELVAGLAYTETVAGSRRSPHVVATNLELARSAGATPPDELPSPDGRWMVDRAPTAPAASLAVLLPGAGHREKQIPVATLAAVARTLRSRVEDVVVAWGPGEVDVAKLVVDATAGAARLAAPTTIRELAALLAGARLVIGGDTGPVHLAASLGVATVGVYLSTNRQRNGPLGPRVATVSAADDRTVRRGSAAARQRRAVNESEIVAACDRALASPPRDDMC